MVLGEVFVDGKMPSPEAAVLAHDAAIPISIAMQHGVPVEEIQVAMGRARMVTPTRSSAARFDLLARGVTCPELPTKTKERR